MESNNTQENAISLSDIMRVLWKNKILVILLTLVCFAAGIVYAYAFTTPVYKSSTKIVVAVEDQYDKEDVDYTNSLRCVYTVGDFATSDAVAQAVQKKHYELSQATIRSHISTVVSDTSYVIVVSYSDTDKSRCPDVLNDVVDAIINGCKENEAMALLKITVGKINDAQPAVYSSPNRKLYVLVSFVLGLVLSFVVIFLKEFMSTKFVQKDDIQYYLNKNILGLFVDNKDWKEKQKEKKDKAPSPIELLEPTITNYEPYNRLLSAIEYSNLDKPFQTIMFTSTETGELKTTTAVNLASCIANNDKSVCIIDMDTRHPSVHKPFYLERENGIIDYIRGDLSLDEIIKHAENKVDIVTAGVNVVNPIVMLKSEGLASLMRELKERYDYVIIDSPPAAGLSDSVFAAKYADAVIFNVAMNQTKKKLVRESIRVLEASGANVIGVNVTKANVTKSEYYYYYNSYYI